VTIIRIRVAGFFLMMLAGAVIGRLHDVLYEDAPGQVFRIFNATAAGVSAWHIYRAWCRMTSEIDEVMGLGE
jgi:hypothetical protein